MVKHNNQWGTVCDDYFGVIDAQSACHTLGFSGVIITDALEDSSSDSHSSDHGTSYISDSDGPVWMDNVNCATSTTNFLECSHAGWGKENCGHDEDVLLTCT